MSGNFLHRGGLWVLGQNMLLCAVLAGGILYRHQWQHAPATLCGILLLLMPLAAALRERSAWAGI